MKIFILLLLMHPLNLLSIPKIAQNSQNNKKYRLVWSDEFNYKGKPNPLKWRYESGFVRNYESQYYTDRKKNARVKNGHLIIQSRKEKFKNKAFKSNTEKNWRLNKKYAQYTSASLTTKGLADWKYAKIEVRAKLPKGRGNWSAIWMLNAENNDGQNSSGEIDIMENVGYEPNFIYGTVHAKPSEENEWMERSKKTKVEKPYDKFHIYSIEWTPEKIDFKVDGKVYHRVSKQESKNEWVFDQRFYLKINNAIGGSWGRRKGIDDSSFPQKMYIDYVRVFQLTEK